MIQVERCPLHWPAGQPRCRSPKEADFKVEFARARDELLHGLKLLGARNTVLSSNIPLRHDGLPYASFAEPKDHGVAVYFDRKLSASASHGEWKPFVIACDTYSKARWNTRAIGATVEALRSIQRHGATSMLEQAFAGFAALPPKTSDEIEWWTLFDLPKTATKEEIRVRYLDLVQTHHPDKGGDAAMMATINRLYAFALTDVAQ